MKRTIILAALFATCIVWIPAASCLSYFLPADNVQEWAIGMSGSSFAVFVLMVIYLYLQELLGVFDGR